LDETTLGVPGRNGILGLRFPQTTSRGRRRGVAFYLVGNTEEMLDAWEHSTKRKVATGLEGMRRGKGGRRWAYVEYPTKGIHRR